MQIINGRWVDDNNEPLEYHLAGKQIKSLGESVVSVFGENNITPERINIIRILAQRDKTKEVIIDSVIGNTKLMNRLAGLTLN